jgi:CubicO group peptidase (beta-lactamase class C family)
MLGIVVGLVLACPIAANAPIRPPSAVAFGAAERAGMSSGRLDRAVQILRDAVERRVAGSAVALVERRGEVVLYEAFGEMEPGVPMRRDAICRMASIGKSITAVAAMVLVERAVLRLDDPVAKYLPEYGEVQVEERDQATGAVRRLPPQRPPTVRDLLLHTAGFGPEDGRYDAVWRDAETVADFAAALARLPLTAHPGAEHRYGPAYEVLAALIERASGLPFDSFVEREVLTPLGMVDTSFRVPEEKLGRYAGIYEKDVTGDLRMYRRRGQEEPPTRFTSGGGGLRGTVGDFHRFARMLLDRGELDGARLLSPKTVELMTSDHLSSLSPDAEGGWALGFWVRRKLLADLGSAGAFGWNGGTGTLFLVDPAERLIIVVFLPSQPRTPGVWEVRDAFVTAIYQAIVASGR